MSTEIACCRACGSYHVALIKAVAPRGKADLVYYYACTSCGHSTPVRPQATDAAQDVDWCPSHDARVR